jgi:hypothetical protein
VPGVGAAGAAGPDVGAMSKDLFGNFTPAAKDLAEAADLYAKALDIKIKDNKAGAESKNESAVDLADMEKVNQVAKEVAEQAKDPDKLNMSPEQKETLKQAHQKLLSGGGKFVAVSAPTALAIKHVTDKDPKALALHPDLVRLAASCAKDGNTILGLLSDSRKLCKAKAIDVPEDTEFKPQ